MNKNDSLVVKASLNHLNRLSNTSDEATLENNSCTRVSSLTLYVPRRVNIDRILEENPPNFRYKRDCFVYILHLISSIPSKKKEVIDKNNGFTPLNSTLLQKRIHGYKKYVSYLREQGILIRTTHYIPGRKSYGYKFSERFNSTVTLVAITKWTLIKSILKNNKQQNIEKTEELNFLKQWFNSKLEVDIRAGQRYLRTEFRKDRSNQRENLHQTYNARFLPLRKLYDNNYDFHVDNKGYRLHTNLTQLKSELRKNLKYNGKNLCAVDITNSQPFLTIALLDKTIFLKNNIQDKIINPNLTNNNSIMLVDLINEIENKPDVIKFKRMVSSGKFYEEFGKILIDEGIVEVNENCDIRAIAKKITFSTFFSANTSIAHNNYIRVFRRKFPNVYRVFKLIKTGRKKHNSLAIALQRLEAELVLDNACKIINRLKPNVPIYTLHDSIITTEENVDFIELIMTKVLKKQIGIKPNLKIEPWT